MDTKEIEKIEISKIIITDELYPRRETKPDYDVVSRYENLMRLKEIFPPIVLNYSKRKYYLIDGLHRLTAMRNKGEEYIDSEIHRDLSPSRVLEMAVELNKKHGHRLTLGDLIYSAKKLEKMNINIGDISKIVGIDESYLKRNMLTATDIKKRHSPQAMNGPILSKRLEKLQYETCVHCNGTGKILRKKQ